MTRTRFILLFTFQFVGLQAVQSEEAIIFTSAAGDSVEAFEGKFFVPENRVAKNSRKIPISYVRFPSTSKSPGSPIIYLSGGPGGSGIQTAKHQRFSLFMAMREHGDVIALDQRGTGQSNDTPNCLTDITVPIDRVVKDEEYFRLQRRALTECLSFWDKAGVDVYGYTTRESAFDLDDLRKHLGADKISLWGISYGSHLALAAFKTMQEHLDRVIIATVEGLDQTIKMPARTDAYFDRLQAAINQNEEMKEQFPDIKALIRRVHKSMDVEPLKLSVPVGGNEQSVLLVKRDLQQICASAISDPHGAIKMLRIYKAIEQGDTGPLVGLLQRFGDQSPPISFRAMSVAMDLASGQSTKRYEKIMKQAKTSLLGSFLNHSVHLTGVIHGIDLGDEFRTAPVSDVPTLVLRGTLDGRIYPDSQIEATAGLNNRTVVTVVNAGHNLFMTSPKVAAIMRDFMNGASLEDSKIDVELAW